MAQAGNDGFASQWATRVRSKLVPAEELGTVLQAMADRDEAARLERIAARDAADAARDAKYQERLARQPALQPAGPRPPRKWNASAKVDRNAAWWLLHYGDGLSVVQIARFSGVSRVCVAAVIRRISSRIEQAARYFEATASRGEKETG